MGRISRQRKYKSCDPFSKSNFRTKEDSFNKAPKKKDIDDGHFQKSKNFERRQQMLDRASNKTHALPQETFVPKKGDAGIPSKKKNKKKSTENVPTMKPNESKKEYFRRLDEKIQGAIHESMMDTKKLRKKRKQHLKERDERLKQKKTKDTNDDVSKDFSSLKDEVEFGDVVMQPPSISALPRKAAKDANKQKVKSLHLASLLSPNKNADDTKVANKKRKEMTHVEQQKFDIERQKAIDAYREIKKRKQMARDET